MSPTAVGKYAVGYQVRELRQIPNQSYHIGTVTRLMLIDVPCLTSLNDIEIENGIVVYPNPVSNILTIEMLTYSSEKKYISIYDILGKQVLSESFSSQKHTVNVSELVKGIYVVELRIGKNLVRKKFVKNKGVFLGSDEITSVYLHRLTRNHEKGNYSRSVYYRAAGRFSVR